MSNLSLVMKTTKKPVDKRLLVLHGKTLGISRIDISRLSLIQLKNRAKKKFHEIAVKFHPDKGILKNSHGLQRGRIFRAALSAYNFFKNLISEIRREDEIEFCITPWEWSRNVGVPYGYQEFTPGPV